MYLKSNLKLLRKRRGRTQDDVAFTLGMKRSTLSGYENGVAEPALEILMAFSKYYKIAIDTMLTVNLESLSESQLFNWKTEPMYIFVEANCGFWPPL